MKRENVRLTDATQRHIQRLTARGYAPATIKSHQHSLNRLAKWLHQHAGQKDPYLHLIEDVTLERHLYGHDGVRGGVGAAAFNNQIAILKSFFHDAHQRGWTETDPAVNLERARKETLDPALILTADELLAVLERADNARDRAAIALGINTALRVSDLKRLTIFDVNLLAGVITTKIRKTKNTDTKAITFDLDGELRRWLDEYARRTGFAHRDQLPNEWLLIPARSWNPTDPDGWKIKPTVMINNPQWIVQHGIKALGYPTAKTGFHTLRRSAARALFDMLRDSDDPAGRDHALMIVKAFLNHKTTAMTEHYLGLSSERDQRDKLLRGQAFLSRMTTTMPVLNSNQEVKQWQAG